MNLIEKLGGYEKAKNIRLGNEEDWMFYSIKKDWYSDIKHDDSFIFIDEIKYKLCEHRREHSIFEVGDKIVSKESNGEDWELMICEINFFHKKMITTTSLCGNIVNHYNFRHATDEEIKAGHRISHADNLSHFDHCTDIRNHISPNTIVLDNDVI